MRNHANIPSSVGSTLQTDIPRKPEPIINHSFDYAKLNVEEQLIFEQLRDSEMS